MKYQKILITGGAGFVGSNLALKIKSRYPACQVVVLDNLKRRGSELNLPRLSEAKIEFIHGDVRIKGDLLSLPNIDLIIECSAEPSVLAGMQGTPDYLIDTNLVGALNCLELARLSHSDFIFLSTSRVYPIEYLESLSYKEAKTRFELTDKQTTAGASKHGIAENFPIDKPRSLYGTTKLSAEYFLQEYITAFDIKGVINRCGVITGPWQFGKVDQGVFVYWLANHYFHKELRYIGYGGTGKQVRDFMHIDDLFEAIDLQINNMNKYQNQTYNLGGGRQNSLSLAELTSHCQKLTGRTVKVKGIKKNRPNDIRIYITDSRKFQRLSGWQCRKNAQDTLLDIFNWIRQNEDSLKRVLT